MGFFSWKTADTRSTIWNRHAYEQGGPRHRTVYMLSPDGAAPIEEPAYEGYGVFGGVDAFAHLARMNLPAERQAGMDEDMLRTIGCAYENGYYELVADGSKHQFCYEGAELIDPDVTYHGVTYDRPIEALGGRTPNDMIADGTMVEREFAIAYPLKFSFRSVARYEDWKASQVCDTQGFFRDDMAA